MQATDKPGADRCPRCGAGFHCGVADAAPCACSTLTLDETTLAALRQQYSGCLCLACLVALASPGRDGPRPAIQADR